MDDNYKQVHANWKKFISGEERRKSLIKEGCDVEKGKKEELGEEYELPSEDDLKHMYGGDREYRRKKVQQKAKDMKQKIKNRQMDKIKSKYDDDEFGATKHGVNPKDLEGGGDMEEAFSQDNEAEIRGMLDDMQNRLDTVSDLLGKDQMDKDANKEIVGILNGLKNSLDAMLDVAGVGKTDENHLKETFDAILRKVGREE